jgi:hypothetical protein
VASGWWLVAGGWWLVAGGWWLVAGGWWLVAGGWWLVAGGWGAVRTSVTLLVQDIGNTVTFLVHDLEFIDSSVCGLISAPQGGVSSFVCEPFLSFG